MKLWLSVRISLWLSLTLSLSSEILYRYHLFTFLSHKTKSIFFHFLLNFNEIFHFELLNSKIFYVERYLFIADSRLYSHFPQMFPIPQFKIQVHFSRFFLFHVSIPVSSCFNSCFITVGLSFYPVFNLGLFNPT